MVRMLQVSFLCSLATPGLYKGLEEQTQGRLNQPALPTVAPGLTFWFCLACAHSMAPSSAHTGHL